MNIGQCLTKSARIFSNNLAIAYGKRKTFVRGVQQSGEPFGKRALYSARDSAR